jgi:hypothetical protein
LERLLELGEDVRSLARLGAAPLLASRALVGRLENAGLVTRSYRVDPGGEVACTVDHRDVYSALLLSADTQGSRRVDFVYESTWRNFRVEDIPFDPDGVAFVETAERLRAAPSGSRRLRLVAVDEKGERILGEYVLVHTAYSPSI